ncbi:hypothetical protein [Polyangium aurulentum]|uniref:hypothetical protein n=1 Tax=Polyangium aurulentum TaxID=2567896 RepID=UPI0010ADC28D|nr:hypothetical protein [Polyangium aurulentum]UQA56787.1 hypothetical protein E8A73_036620 [Polyangium aurulentum]
MSRSRAVFAAAALLLALPACGGGGGGQGPSAAPPRAAAGVTVNAAPAAAPSEPRNEAPAAARPPRGRTWTEHVQWAKRMADEVKPSANAYANDPTVLAWKGEDGARETSNRSVCASFVYALLMKSYGYTTADFKRWLGSPGPTPVHFSRAIEEENGFSRVTKAADLSPGDILGVVYPEGSDSIGHVMVVADKPTQHPESAPKVEGTVQFAVSIYDSTSSPHGEGDSRTREDMKGAGRGRIRIYADAVSGEIKGYTWSLSRGSVYYDAATRPLVAGRLDGTVLPAR